MKQGENIPIDHVNMIEKALDKIEHPFIIKTLRKLVVEGNLLHVKQDIYEKPTANIKLNGERLKSFRPKIRKKMRMPTFATTFTTVLEVLARKIRQETHLKAFSSET